MIIILLFFLFLFIFFFFFRSLDISISLCGHLDSGLTDEIFNQFAVSYDDFVANPMVIDNPELVVRIGGKYYNWRMACPLIMSMSLYKKSLPQVSKAFFG